MDDTSIKKKEITTFAEVNNEDDLNPYNIKAKQIASKFKKEKNQKIKENKNKNVMDNTTSILKKEGTTSTEDVKNEDNLELDNKEKLNDCSLKAKDCLSKISVNIVAIVITVLSVLLSIQCFITETPVESPYPNNNRLHKKTCVDFRSLQHEYPEQKTELWIRLKVGVEKVLNGDPVKPSIFMLVHDSNSRKNDLVKSIVNVTHYCLGNTLEPLMLTNFDFNSFDNDFGDAIEFYRKPLQASGIMLVEQFDQIHPKTAQAFHTICDTESPLVKRSVIFLTMPIPLSQDIKFRKLTENTLKKLWKDHLAPNILNPLLTRVTDAILLLE